MAVYINQINKRRAAEKAALNEVNEKTNERLGLQQRKHAIPQTDKSALRQANKKVKRSDEPVRSDDP